MATPFRAYARRPAALFTDVDGTLTTAGRVTPSSYAALAAVAAAGIPVVIVTGRPAGWADAMARLWPVAGAVAENGAVTFAARAGRGDSAAAAGGERIERSYGLPADDIPGLRTRMLAAVDEVQRAVPGARLSADSRYREVDLAIDWNEEAALSRGDAERIAELLRGRGFCAVRSSVHVNFGPIGVDKLTACRALVADLLGGDASDLSPYLYVGDALNDAPLFAGFPSSVGVANVRDVWDELPHRPRYITDAAEGAGFEEVCAGILAAPPLPA
jgi:hydroxymethylpyrimidine pyrophosphatase-like HAD family hydrolase